MKIVVLDAYAANPGDLSWEKLQEIGEVAIYDRTAAQDVAERAMDAEVILTNKVRIDRELMEALPKLRYVGVLATGYNVVDTEAACEHGIVVTNIPAYGTMSVAQMVFAHLMNICNRVAHYSEAVDSGRWSTSRDFCFYDTPLLELAGRTMCIVGLGNIGMAVAKMAQAFGMKIMAVTRKSEEELHCLGIQKANSYEELFAHADVLSLHCPLAKDTMHLVNASRLALMNPSAILINTGRGPLIDEQALADALNSGRLYAAGIDVLSEEPPVSTNPLIGARNCYITPHIAWATKEARGRLIDIAIENIKAFMEGTPRNVVS